MSVKQFTVGFSRTINLGNFESARVEAQVTIEDESSTQAVAEAQQELRKLLEATWREQFRPKDKETVIARQTGQAPYGR